MHFSWVDSRWIVCMAALAGGHTGTPAFARGLSLWQQPIDKWLLKTWQVRVTSVCVSCGIKAPWIPSLLHPRGNAAHFTMLSPGVLLQSPPCWQNLKSWIKKPLKSTFSAHCSVKEPCISAATFPFWSIYLQHALCKASEPSDTNQHHQTYWRHPTTTAASAPEPCPPGIRGLNFSPCDTSERELRDTKGPNISSPEQKHPQQPHK